MPSDPTDLRLLIVPGLHGSGTDHWQSLLQHQHAGAVRVAVADWSHADLDAWAAAIGQTLARASVVSAPPAPLNVADPLSRWRLRQAPTIPHPPRWIAVAHSFGCLALAHFLLRGGVGVVEALMVAPANPDRFGIAEGVLDRRLPVDSTLVYSRNDPWLPEPDARYLARCWGSDLLDAGMAGHINPSSGHGRFAPAQQWLGARLPHRPPHVPPVARPAPAASPRTAGWRFAV